jgi:hypothetical protein
VGLDKGVDGRLGNEQPAADLDVKHFPRDAVRVALADAQPLGEFHDRQQPRSARRSHDAQ